MQRSPTRLRPSSHALIAIVSCLFAAALCVGHASSSASADSGLEELFHANSHSLEMTDGKLSGAGSEFLLGESEDVQFFCLAEPHNVREIPEFVTALFEQLQEKLGFRYLAIEQGPGITDWIGRLAQSREDDEIRQLAKKQRKALHFRTAQEVEMIADVSRASEGSIQGVWGLDRVLDSSFVEKYLASPEGRADPEAEFLAERATWSAENLAKYKAKPDSAAGRSANQHREDGFKSGFRHYYDRATPEDGPPPRVIFRFGHVHMGRLAKRSYGTLGSYLGEFAEENDLESFHLNIQLINEPGRYWSLTDYPEYEALSRVGNPTKWIIVDLRPARAAIRAGAPRPNDKLLKSIFNFDAVLLMGGASKGDKL